MQTILLNLERVFGRLPIHRIIEIHRRKVAMLTPLVQAEADLKMTIKEIRLDVVAVISKHNWGAISFPTTHRRYN